MKFYYIEPEVSGGWGDNTIVNTDSRPPVVSKLHYEFDGWLGDVLLESFPVFILTEQARKKIGSLDPTGVSFHEVEITTSEQFEELFPDLQLPAFVWLRPTGSAGRDDFGVAADRRLVVSERVLSILKVLGLAHADIEPFD
jgi:hypothetical protein